MNRIELLASLAKDSVCLADIGCDHGFICITALLKYNVSRAYACDIGKLPLESAKNNIIKYGLNDRIQTVLSAGFDNVEFDFDTACIAGMGGLLIIDILKAHLSKLKDKKLILQANKDQDKLRSFMQENGFKLLEEHAIIDSKKYYEVLVYNTGIDSYSEFELKYGPFLLKNKPQEFIIKMENSLKLKEMNYSKAKSEESKSFLENEINELKAVLNND